MRYLFLSLLPLLLVLKTNAQRTFSLKDLNDLKQLAAPWIVKANTDLPIYEDWQIANDSLLNGTWYRVAEDTNYLPEASLKLYYANNTITLEYTYAGPNDPTGTTFTFQLKSIDRGVYFFENTAATLTGSAKQALKENVPYGHCL
ncbi:MAG: hypothetical protein JNM21_03645 [Taibaiella sp.]|nr:hypothetical protein [Taibaiella sp.]